MIKYSFLSIIVALGLIFSSCNQTKKGSKPSPKVGNTQCFIKTSKRDTTTVSLTINGDEVTGEMIWKPWEKDSSAGTLAGKRNASGELELIYTYVIEGNNQTETVHMKMEFGKLFIKQGQLDDPKSDGNLVYADVSKALYSEMLDEMPCK